MIGVNRKIALDFEIEMYLFVCINFLNKRA